MTKFRSNYLFVVVGVLALAGCETVSGVKVAGIAEPGIEAAYIPLQGTIHLGIDNADGAGVTLGQGIAVTNAHNANLVDARSVIGASRDYDLLFFHTGRSAAPATAEPKPGEAVRAYGQPGGKLRLAHGVVREITGCAGCSAPAYFTFEGDAGPGFSGGPVVDVDGRLVGITFGYKDAEKGHQRLIYAYEMARVKAELAGVTSRLPVDSK